MTEDRVPTTRSVIRGDGSMVIVCDDDPASIEVPAWAVAAIQRRVPEPLLGCYGGIPHRCSRCGFEIPAGTAQPAPTPTSEARDDRVPRTPTGRELVEDEPRLVTGEHDMRTRVLRIEAEACPDPVAHEREADMTTAYMVGLEKGRSECLRCRTCGHEPDRHGGLDHDADPQRAL